MLLGRQEIVTWEQIERKLAAFPIRRG